METCPYPKLTTKMRISANQARKQTQEWICFRAFLRPYEQGYTGAVCRPVCRKINRLNCPVSSGRHRYICWSRGIFPGHSKQEKERFRMKSHNDHLTLTSGPESNPAGAVSGRAAPTSTPSRSAAGGRIIGRQQPSLHLAPGCASAAGDDLPPAFSGVPATILNPQRQQRQTSGLLRASP